MSKMIAITTRPGSYTATLYADGTCEVTGPAARGISDTPDDTDGWAARSALRDEIQGDFNALNPGAVALRWVASF